MNRFFLLMVCLSSLTMAGCAAKEKQPEAQLFSPGEKATVGPLTYSLVDSQIVQQLGDDPVTARTPQNRFILVQVSVSNSGGQELPIPAMTLVDDSGQDYNELADGTGVQHWLGMVRRVSPAQTDTGVIVFDAPAKHYRLRLTDEFAPAEIAIDMPLTFIHEQLQNAPPPSVDPSSVTAPPVGLN